MTYLTPNYTSIFIYQYTPQILHKYCKNKPQFLKFLFAHSALQPSVTYMMRQKIKAVSDKHEIKLQKQY